MGLVVRPRCGHFTLGKRPGTHGIGGWVGPRDGMDSCGKCRPHPSSAEVKERVEPYLNPLLSAFMVSYWENGLDYE